MAGTRGRTLIVNLPGSKKAAVENLDAVLPALGHGLDVPGAIPEIVGWNSMAEVLAVCISEVRGDQQTSCEGNSLDPRIRGSRAMPTPESGTDR